MGRFMDRGCVRCQTPQVVPPSGSAAPSKAKPNGKTVLLTVTDPEGYEITVDLDTWENHIVAGHPEMRECLEILSLTLTEPYVIYRSSKESETHYYYRLTGRSFKKVSDVYLNAVVQRHDETKKGSVKTAFLLKRLRREGQLVWMHRKSLSQP